MIIFHSKVDKATWILCKKGSCLRTQNFNECTILYFLNVYIKWILRIYTWFYNCGATSVMFIISECLFLSIVAARTQDHWSGEGGGATVHDATHHWHCRPMDASSCFSDKTELYCILDLKVRWRKSSFLSSVWSEISCKDAALLIMAISASRLSFLRGRTNNQHCNAMFCHDAKRKSKVEQMRTRQTKTLLIVWKILQKVAQIVDLMARRKSEAICYNNQEILGWTGRGCLLFFYTASSPLLIWRKIFSSLAIWMAVLKKYLIVDI